MLVIGYTVSYGHANEWGYGNICHVLLYPAKTCRRGSLGWILGMQSIMCAPSGYSEFFTQRRLLELQFYNQLLLYLTSIQDTLSLFGALELRLWQQGLRYCYK